jgi:hypothetical protein
VSPLPLLRTKAVSALRVRRTSPNKRLPSGSRHRRLLMRSVGRWCGARRRMRGRARVRVLGGKGVGALEVANLPEDPAGVVFGTTASSVPQAVTRLAVRSWSDLDGDHRTPAEYGTASEQPGKGPERQRQDGGDRAAGVAEHVCDGTAHGDLQGDTSWRRRHRVPPWGAAHARWARFSRCPRGTRQ